MVAGHKNPVTYLEVPRLSIMVHALKLILPGLDIFRQSLFPALVQLEHRVDEDLALLRRRRLVKIVLENSVAVGDCRNIDWAADCFEFSGCIAEAGYNRAPQLFVNDRDEKLPFNVWHL